MAMCEKKMNNVVNNFNELGERNCKVAKEMKEKSSMMKKKVDNTRAVINNNMNVFQDIIKAIKSMDVSEKNEEQKLWNEKMKNAMCNFQGSLDFLELTSQHCYTIDERSKILIRDSEKLNVPFTSNE
uniref:Biogenesis of lysosome-related organelles complex 1 subunit 1 n=1 Tax=Strongyloides venezuelensis TaxID=75913 RepID=A0A0K0FZE4_STRVS